MEVRSACHDHCVAAAVGDHDYDGGGDGYDGGDGDHDACWTLPPVAFGQTNLTSNRDP